MGFVAVRAEIDPRPLLRALQERGARVAVPRLTGRRMVPAEVTSWDALVPGEWNIPTSDGPVLEDLDLVITPGLGFDARGGRLGYGAGCYDRFFAEHQGLDRGLRAGVGYAIQVVPALPQGALDVRMHLVVTDAGVHRIPPGL